MMSRKNLIHLSLFLLTVLLISIFLSFPKKGVCSQDSISTPKELDWIERWSQIRAILNKDNLKRNFVPFVSNVIRAGERPQKISVNIAGLDTLYLIATIGLDNYDQDHAVWGEAVLIGSDGSKTRLCDLKPTRSKAGWSELFINENYNHKHLKIAKRKLKHGLLAHAHSEIVYPVNKKYVRLKARIGIDDESGEKGDVIFKVLGCSEDYYWKQLEKEFPLEKQTGTADINEKERALWLYNSFSINAEKELIQEILGDLGQSASCLISELQNLSQMGTPVYSKEWLQLYITACRLRFALRELESMNHDNLKQAIQDLIIKFPSRYANGTSFLVKVEKLKAQKSKIKNLVNWDDHAITKAMDFTKEYNNFKREALLQNPLLNEHPILFTTRHQYKPDHHNTATLFLTGEVNTNSFQGGGALKKIDFSQNGKITTLLETKTGIVRDPEIGYDGEKIVFSMRKDIKDNYHIYEMSSNGRGLKQLTHTVGVADFDPVYLPDNSIVFSSTREPKYCMCNIHIMANLFRMEADGANIFQIGKSTLFEGHSSILPDGRILYDRWEYVDRNFGDAQGLWTVNPDGTNHALYWGNNTNSPGGVIDARIIPGTNKIIAILGSCHDRPWGALGIIDRRLGLDGKNPIIKTWPPKAINLVGVGDFDTFKRVSTKYEDPFPLSDSYFLCSRKTGNEEQMGIYLLDVFGNEVMLHTEEPGCYDPMPIMPHPRQRIMPYKRNFKAESGTFYVQDVYLGTQMAGVERGTVKYLRVIESPEKRFWTEPAWSGQGVHRPALNWHSFENKRILGTVPVETDGSVYFEVPSEKFVYFQLLNEDGAMIQSMRSGTIIQPGEKQGCIGCHESRRTAPPATRKMPIALGRAPSKLNGWYGPPRNFSYTKEVQPVFDKHCVQCHDFDKKAGKKLILAGDRNMFFNASYIELWRKKYISSIGAGPHAVQAAVTWGAQTSKLIEVIRKGHKNIKMSKEEMDRIQTWIDINGVYYPEYSSAYPKNLAGRSPLNDKQVRRLEELTAIKFKALAGHQRKMGPQVCFERPEKSPCLKKLSPKKSPEYKEALQIIQSGADMLRIRPRADMLGFFACETDNNRQKKYDYLKKLEIRNRIAIHNGEKKYDEK